MNSLIISQILNNFNYLPYYNLNNYISINDDRMSRIVSFKLYEKNEEILVEFKEAHRNYPYISTRHKTFNIISLEDFKDKWTCYYNLNYTN